ncbi:MAG: site-2 protease family protein, partial [Prevotella sp.]|nr:site-2 protease family protein [Prevotella sp.]
MDIFLIRLLQFMLAIGLLVLLHEGGHFFFAKLFGVKVDKFYLFFDPSIWKWDGSIFKWKPKNSDTQYGMGWLPLGGYCKIAGMIDESFDTEQMKQPEQPWEFRAKPAWQRLLIMIGGVLVNFLLALFIYSMILFHWGDSYIPVKNMTYGMKFNTEAKALGFQDGDILIGTDKGEFKEFSADLYRDLSEATRVDLIRDGKKMSLTLPGDLNLLGMLKAEPSFVRPLIPAEVDSVMADSPAAGIGLQQGDKIVAINDKPVDSYNEFVDQLGILEDMMTAAKTSADSLKIRTATIVY